MPVKNDLPKSIALTYHLAELPTAQHKAGLAGLLLLIRNLQERNELGHGVGELPEIVEMDTRKATMRVTSAGLVTLFDDLYNAQEVTNDKGKTFVQPSGEFLAFWLEGNTESPWLKLWREMLWATFRSIDKQRIEFQTRAAGKSLSAMAQETFDQLVDADKKRAKGQFKVDKLASTFFVGAQASNAEQVPFKGRVEENLLLHFWLLVSPIFVPQMLDLKKDDREYFGYLLAVPEVADLEWFLEEMPGYWRSLKSALAGYRPAESLIDLPAEGGLEFLYHLAQRRVAQSSYSLPLLAVELYHLNKVGNNVRLLASERIRPDPAMLEEYQTHLRDSHANPLFKRLAIGNLIAGCPWYAAAQPLLANYPAEYFIGKPAKARFRPFGYDARKRFNTLIEQLKLLEQHKETTMTDTPQTQLDDALARRVYQMIGAYVRLRTKEKCGKDVADLPKGENGYPVYPTDYREAREKAAKEAFLALRGRREGDIAEYFTGSLCAVPQFLKEDDFIALSRALIEKPEQVKDLAMLALSAHAYLPGQKADNQADASGAE